MIEVRYKYRLGNCLFQYCLGRIIAQELGFALEAEDILGFPRTQEEVLGNRYGHPYEVLTGYRVDFERLRTDRTPRRVILDGYFQRYEYYRPYREQIQSWLKLSPAIQTPAPEKKLVLNVRRKDYVGLGWALPFSYYEEAIQLAKAEGDNIWIVTDAPNDPFFNRFKSFRPNFFSGSPLEQLAFMIKSRRLVLSQSTFSWWAGFLGNQEEIYAPVPKQGIWANPPNGNTPNLIERDRFVCIECKENYIPTPSELLHHKWNLFKHIVILILNMVLLRRLGRQLKSPFD